MLWSQQTSIKAIVNMLTVIFDNCLTIQVRYLAERNQREPLMIDDS